MSEARPEPNHDRFLNVVIFAALLAPLSVGVAGDTVSANYAFALLLLGGRDGYKKDLGAFIYICFCVCCWLVGIVLFSSGDGAFLTRQTVSAFLWVLGPLLLFLRLKVTVRELALATIVVSVAYSLFVFVEIFRQGIGLSDVYLVKKELRDFVTDWPQRYVVVLFFGFFTALERSRRGIGWSVCALTILACIFVTFTRAAWLAVALGLAAYFGASWWAQRGARQQRRRGSAATGVLSVVVILGGIAYAATNPVLIKVFWTLYDNMSLIANLLFTGGNFETGGSEDTRIVIWSHVFEIVGQSPVTGTGFAGPGLLISGTGAAHSQYLDVLLRTGVIGLGFYLYYWMRVLLFCANRHPGLFGAMVAMGLFGCFHESTKLSYGALLFFVLLNKAIEERRAIRVGARGRDYDAVPRPAVTG